MRTPRIPMGLQKAPASFQIVMNIFFPILLINLWSYYMEDIIIFSKCEKYHLLHVEEEMKILEESDLYVSTKQCQFMKEEMEFLGLTVRNNGICVSSEKVEIFQQWWMPKSVTDLRGFIRLLQWSRRVLIACPLTSLLKTPWIKQMEHNPLLRLHQSKKGYHVCISFLSPNRWKELRCHVDVSQIAVGRTLTPKTKTGPNELWLVSPGSILNPNRTIRKSNGSSWDSCIYSSVPDVT